MGNDAIAQECRTVNGTISKATRRKIREYNINLVTNTIEENESLKTLKMQRAIDTK